MVKHLLIYFTWVDYEGDDESYIGVFDSNHDALKFMFDYAKINKLGHPEESKWHRENDDVFYLPKETLDRDSYSDGHGFSVKAVPYSPKLDEEDVSNS